MTDISQLDLGLESIGDSGEASDDSINPISNSERQSAATLNRQPEILRNRIEQLRREANRNRWARDMDRGPFLIELQKAELTWDGSSVSLSNPQDSDEPKMVISSITRPGEPRNVLNEDVSKDAYTRFAAGFEAHPTQSSAVLQFVSERFAYQGGNEISIEAVEDSGLSDPLPKLELKGNAVDERSEQPGRDNIVITFNPSTHSIQDLLDAFDPNTYNNTAPAAIDEVDVSYSSDPSHSMFAFDSFTLEGGFDAVRYVITGTALSSFFASSDNQLNYRDTLAISLSSIQDRREHVGANVSVTDLDLVNLSESPGESDNCVPICTYATDTNNNDFLVFVNNHRLESGASTTTMESSSQVRDDLFQPSSTADTPPTPGDSSASGGQRVLLEDNNFATLDPPETGNGATVQDTADEIDSKVDTLESEVNSNNTDISTLQSNVNDNSNDISELSTEVGNLEGVVAPGDGLLFNGTAASDVVAASLGYFAFSQDTPDKRKFQLRLNGLREFSGVEGPGLVDLDTFSYGEARPRGGAYDNIRPIVNLHDVGNNRQYVKQQRPSVDGINSDIQPEAEEDIAVDEFDRVFDSAADGRHYVMSAETATGNLYLVHIPMSESGSLQTLDITKGLTNTGAASTDPRPMAVATNGQYMFVVYEQSDTAAGGFLVEKRPLSNIDNVSSSTTVSTANNDQYQPAAFELYYGRMYMLIENQDNGNIHLMSGEARDLNTLALNEGGVNTLEVGGTNADFDQVWITDKRILACQVESSGTPGDTALYAYDLNRTAPGGAETANEYTIIPDSTYVIADLDFDEDHLFIATVEGGEGAGAGTLELMKFDRELNSGTQRVQLEQNQAGTTSALYSDGNDEIFYDVHVMTNGYLGYVTSTDVGATPDESQMHLVFMGEFTKEFHFHGIDGETSKFRPRYRGITEV